MIFLCADCITHFTVISMYLCKDEQAVRQLTSYIEELRAETASKDDIIAALRTELALRETGLEVDRHVSESTGETATFQSPSTPPSLEVDSQHPAFHMFD